MALKSKPIKARHPGELRSPFSSSYKAKNIPIGWLVSSLGDEKVVLRASGILFSNTIMRSSPKAQKKEEYPNRGDTFSEDSDMVLRREEICKTFVERCVEGSNVAFRLDFSLFFRFSYMYNYFFPF